MDDEDEPVSDNERFYDEEIAPALMDLCKRCHERGLSFLAAVEYAAGAVGRTSAFVDGYGHAMSNALASIQATDNADLLIMHLVRRAREYGHGSAYLFQLGVPTSPSGYEPRRQPNGRYIMEETPTPPA